jgi:hypothetical protein
MSWFHYTKQERLKVMIAARREQAEVVRKHLRHREFYALNPRLLTEALAEATELPYIFEEYFAEAAPLQFRKATELEVQLWASLRDGRDTKDFNDDAYEALQIRMSFVVTALIDLLTAEEEMTNSPVVAHYLQLIDSLRSYAKRGQT